ncbi:MAG: cell division protein FtsZ, partial [Mycobacterium sp.]|nr:cell division protein FtsZ [Mycobacterium sp.]
ANIIFGTVIDDSLGDEVRVTVIAAGFDATGPGRKPVTGEATAPASAAPAQPIAPGRAGRVTSSLFEPSDPASVPAHTNGATVRIGGGDDGGISDDDVDVPPFMRH